MQDIGNVAIDSIQIWIPNYEIEFGMQAVDELFDGKLKSNSEFFEYRDPEGNRILEFDDPPQPVNSTKTHPRFYSRTKPKNFHGIRITKKGLPIGSGNEKRQTEGIVVDLGSKHLGKDYLRGVHRGTWSDLVRELSELSGFVFKSDLFTCRVQTLDLRGDILLDELDSTKSALSFSPLEKELDKLVDHIGKARLYKGRGNLLRKGLNWGFTSRPRKDRPLKGEARRSPFFTIYSKYYEYLNRPDFADFIHHYKIDVELLSRIVRIESRIHHAQVVAEVFGTNQVQDVILPANDELYIRRLNKTIGLWMDPDKFPFEKPKPVKSDEKLTTNLLHYVLDLESHAEALWSRFSAGHTKRQASSMAKQFWSKESIQDMAKVCAQRYFETYLELVGETRSTVGGNRKQTVDQNYQKAANIVYDKKKAKLGKLDQLDLQLYNDDELRETIKDRLIRLGAYWLAPKYIETKRVLDELNSMPVKPSNPKYSTPSTQPVDTSSNRSWLADKPTLAELSDQVKHGKLDFKLED